MGHLPGHALRRRSTTHGGRPSRLWPCSGPSEPSSGCHRVSSCSDETDEKLPKAYKGSPRPVTGEELCNALNRKDLATLLGTPGETATTVSGTNNTAPLTNEKVAQPEAEVKFDTYTVQVSATYDDLSTDQYVKLMKFGNEQNIRTLKVLGRPAVLASDYTMKFEINLGGSGGTGGPVEQGPLARTLSVALDRHDRGGFCGLEHIRSPPERQRPRRHRREGAPEDPGTSCALTRAGHGDRGGVGRDELQEIADAALRGRPLS